jgi:NAD(P)-dependent dehydrogenase (short-subunit alcohol dehydrogenase family)
MVYRNFTVNAGVALGIAASMLLRRRKPISLRDRTVFVSGGPRGLGLLLAEEFASRGAKVAISARDRSELERAETQLRSITDQVLTLEVDMTMREEVELAVQKIEQTSARWTFW